MKVVAIHEYGGPSVLKLEEWDDPVAGEGELLVQTTAASINPIDYKMRSGAAKDRFPVTFPAVLGRDVSGVVMAVGAGVQGFEPGDRVMALTWKTYAELVVVKAADALKLPEGLDQVEAAALPLVLQTGEQLIRLGAKVQPGQTILITGALGAVGRAAVWTAKNAGASVIAGVREHDLKKAAELVNQWGADRLLALDDKDALGSLGFIDAVADTVGGETAQTLLGKIRPGGTYASVVGPPANAALHPTLTISPIMAKPDVPTLAKLAQAVVERHLRIPIDRMVPLADAALAHAVVEKGGIGKVLLTP
ncbi:NADPH:quinone reductase [Granulicella rosea]|uniref:NADPH:quinone reductase n=1 Tax=Granulicella rosea TaxID=474952 RepID=A0A239DRF0_9BACT|nr:NADP-dependent oxidoreductase [Granulicella rosea]SNS34488.1 NADPH:quinone reductase [Granulicella rosea]